MRKRVKVIKRKREKEKAREKKKRKRDGWVGDVVRDASGVSVAVNFWG